MWRFFVDYCCRHQLQISVIHLINKLDINKPLKILFDLYIETVLLEQIKFQCFVLLLLRSWFIRPFESESPQTGSEVVQWRVSHSYSGPEPHY